MAALEEIGVLGMALGCAFSMPSIVGEALHGFASEDLKERFLKPMLKGELIAAEALTEPRGGSDFFGATTVAKADGDHFVIRGQKRFVVAASGADFFVVYCKTDPEAKPHKRISLILIESEREGVEVKHLYNLMGTRGGGTGRLIFRDVRVPGTNLIGELNQGALIFNSMMIPERLTSQEDLWGWRGQPWRLLPVTATGDTPSAERYGIIRESASRLQTPSLNWTRPDPLSRRLQGR